MTTQSITWRERRDMSKRERLLVAIWDGYRDGRPKSLRELAAIAGYASHSAGMSLAQLENEGWIKSVPGQSRSIRPGPRFGGVVNGRPLRIIDDMDQFQADRRTPKYERRGVLFEATV